MDDKKRIPRASIWAQNGYSGSSHYSLEQMARSVEASRKQLELSLRDTGLYLTGLPVIEEVNPYSGGLRLSWEVTNSGNSEGGASSGT